MTAGPSPSGAKGLDLAGAERHPVTTLAACRGVGRRASPGGPDRASPRGAPHAELAVAGGGVAVAYMLVRLLPVVADSARGIGGVTGRPPYADRHAFVLTLTGLVRFDGVRRLTAGTDAPHAGAIRSSVALTAYSWLSFLTGFLLVELEKPGLLPMVFFTLVIGIDFAVRDPSLATTFGAQFDRVWRPVLVAAPFAGAASACTALLLVTPWAQVPPRLTPARRPRPPRPGTGRRGRAPARARRPAGLGVPRGCRVPRRCGRTR